jgi:hypothetical protein
MRCVPFLLSLALLSGCGSYRDDLEKICNAEKLSGAPPGSGLAGTAEWLSANLKTKKSFELLRSLAQEGSIESMRAEMTANGITSCPLLDARTP